MNHSAKPGAASRLRLSLGRVIAVTAVIVMNAALLASCTAPLSHVVAPMVPARFVEAPSSVEVATTMAVSAGAHWWTVFEDPVLDALIDRADRANTSIEQAVARVAQARAFSDGTRADRLPRIGLASRLSRQGGPLINAAGGNGTLIDVAATFAYEVDLIGRVSQVADAAALDLDARMATERSTRLLVEADTASAYFSWLAFDRERVLLRAMAGSYRETVVLLQRRRDAGFASDQDVARMRAEAGAIEAEALAVDRQRAEVGHRIAFLCGASSLEIPSTDAARELVPPAIPAGIPSTVLARRPDVHAAGRSLEAARVRLGVARTAWVPTFSLTASGGYASGDLAELLRSSARSWGIAGFLAATLFDGGRRDAATRSANADLDLAGAAYREQVLNALREVEDQLSTIRLLGEQSAVLRSAVDAATRVAAQSQSLYRNGLVGQIDLLDARRSELRGRRSALQVDGARLAAAVGLVRALGGGWDGAKPEEPLALAGIAR